MPRALVVDDSTLVRTKVAHALTDADFSVEVAKDGAEAYARFLESTFDLVITVCGDAAENCPAWLGGGQQVHIGFPDPVKVTGDAATVRAAFQTTRDDIRRDVLIYLDRFEQLPTGA